VSSIGRLTIQRLLSRKPRRPETAWHSGEAVLIAACDRATGRPERPVVSFPALVTEVNEAYVTVTAGKSEYDFWAEDGWEVYPGKTTPWRIFHEAGRWRL
jgi:hypothetical protein